MLEMGVGYCYYKSSLWCPGGEAAVLVFSKLEVGLADVEKQPANTEKYSGLDKGPATYGVVKQLRDNDMDLHSDQQVQSAAMLRTRHAFRGDR